MNLRVPTSLCGEYDKDVLRHSLSTRDPDVARQAVTLQNAEFIEKLKAKNARAELSVLVADLAPDQRAVYDAAGGLEWLVKSYTETKHAMAFATVSDTDYDTDDIPVDPLETEISKSRDIAAHKVLADLAQEEGKVLQAVGQEVEGLVFGLREMAEKFISESDTTIQTAEAYRYAARRFVELNGDLGLKQLELKHLHNFAIEVLKLPISTRADIRPLKFSDAVKVADAEGLPRIGCKTRDKHINLLKSLMKYAVKTGEFNPPNIWRDYTPSQPKIKYARMQKPRAPFTAEMMVRILDFVKADRDPDTIDYWAPMLGCYQGARREEVGQMMTADIFKRDNIWCMNITDEGDDQSLKNPSSYRLIPIHNNVKAAGFLEYVKKRKKAGGEYLFLERDRWKPIYEEVKPDKRGHLTEPFGKRFIRMLRKSLKINDKKLVFHSFRHSWEDAARAAVIPDAHRRLLSGRSADEGSQNDYGDGYSVKLVSESLNKLNPLFGAK